MQGLKTLLWGVLERSTKSIEHRKGFNLSTVSLLVNDNRRVNICSEFFPVADLSIDDLVHTSGLGPSLLRLTKAVSHTFLSLIEIKIEVLVRIE